MGRLTPDRYRDRRHAGRLLGEALRARALVDPLVLALPRGGVPVAAEIAERLGAPLDVLVARKVGAPGHAEYGIGAVAEGGTVVADRAALRALRIDDAAFERLVDAERVELQRRIERYRPDGRMVAMGGRDVVLVDDGLATGVTAEAALRDVAAAGPSTLVLAVPVGARDTVQRLASIADEVLCLRIPEHFLAVGQWYDRFDPVPDEEVLDLLGRGRD